MTELDPEEVYADCSECGKRVLEIYLEDGKCLDCQKDG